MRMRVVEAGENGATAELDASRGIGGEATDLFGRSNGHDSVPSYRHRFGPGTERIRRENLPTKKNQVCRRLALVLGESSGCEEGKECNSPGDMKHARTVQVKEIRMSGKPRRATSINPSSREERSRV